jgi:hypothetical protein
LYAQIIIVILITFHRNLYVILFIFIIIIITNLLWELLLYCYWNISHSYCPNDILWQTMMNHRLIISNSSEVRLILCVQIIIGLEIIITFRAILLMTLDNAGHELISIIYWLSLFWPLFGQSWDMSLRNSYSRFVCLDFICFLFNIFLFCYILWVTAQNVF